MDPNSAQAMNDNMDVQESLDNMQRGKTINAFELGADYNSDRFTLANIEGISGTTRDAIAGVLKEANIDDLTTLKIEHVARVNAEGGASVSDMRRKQIGENIIRTYLDDAVMDSSVLNELLGEDKEVLATLNTALKEDISLPFDFSKRPDVAIFVRTLFFAVQPASGSTPATLADYKIARLAAIRSIGSLPDNKAIKAVEKDISYLSTSQAKAKDVKDTFVASNLDGKLKEIEQYGDEVEKLYEEMKSMTGIPNKNYINAQIAGQKALKAGYEGKLKNKKVGTHDRDRAIKGLAATEQSLQNLADHLANIALIESRKAKEKAHRSALKGLLEKLDGLNSTNTALMAGFVKPTLDIGTMLTQLGAAQSTGAKVSNNDNEILSYSKIVDTWLKGTATIGGVTTTRLEHIQAAADENLTTIDGEIDEKKAELAKLLKNKGKETSLSDRDFNIGLHMNLAQQDAELSKVPAKDLESAVKLNILSDVLDLKENGRVGKSFNADRRSILEDIKPSDKARFSSLKGVAYYDKKGVMHKPLALYGLSTTDVNNLYADIASNNLPFPSAVFLYAALGLANQAEHPNAQLLRRQIINHLLKKFGDEDVAVKNFKNYVGQAQDALKKAESKGLADSSVERTSKFFAKWAERRKKVAEIVAGKKGLVQNLTEASEAKGGLTLGGALKTVAGHAALRVVPTTLGVAKFTAQNGGEAILGTAKIAGGLITHVPGATLRALGRNLPNIIKPWRLVGNAIGATVKTVLHPVQTLKELSGREGKDLFGASYHNYDGAKKVKEGADKYAEKLDESHKKWTSLNKTYHYEIPNEYDWMSFAWDDTIDKSNVVAAKVEPANDDSKSGDQKAA